MGGGGGMRRLDLLFGVQRCFSEKLGGGRWGGGGGGGGAVVNFEVQLFVSLLLQHVRLQRLQREAAAAGSEPAEPQHAAPVLLAGRG